MYYAILSGSGFEICTDGPMGGMGNPVELARGTNRRAVVAEAKRYFRLRRIEKKVSARGLKRGLIRIRAPRS